MERNLTVKEMPPEERPYEKCLHGGAKTLSDAELLAVILRCGRRGQRSTELAMTLMNYLDSAGGGLKALHSVTIRELMKISGIGRVKAIQLKCVAELSVRMSETYPAKNIVFNSPDSIADYFMEKLRHEEQEQVRLVMLNGKNRYIRDAVISVGTVNASLMSPREIFIMALRQGAVRVLLLHNHPSGDPTPSRQDIQITQRVKETGELLEIPLLDHIIIGDKRYVSLREEGLL